ncbi:MAG TPA: hypothetical protein VGK25_11400 [Ignavibacteria bacterium]
MAVIIKITAPGALLEKIKKAIDEQTVDSWSYDKDDDFTYTQMEWIGRAFFRPEVYEGELRFGLRKPETRDVTKEIYSVYHGRFIEMLLIHFENEFTTAEATAQKTEPDNY